MKKILFVLTMVMMSVCSFGQNYKVVDIPIEVKHEVVIEQKISENVVCDTIKSLRTVESDELVTSKVIKRSYMTDLDGTIHTILTLEDGHVINISVLNNLTLANDVVGSEYSYYITKKNYVPYEKINRRTKYDTTYIEVSRPKTVNLALLKVKSELYIDNKTHYSAKVYSYSLDKAFWVETDSYFYKKHENDKIITKRKAKLNKYYMEYSDYKMFLNFVYTAFRIKNYNFIETPSN